VRVVQRVSGWLGWSMVAAVGVFLILEGTGLIDGGWRNAIAAAIRWVAVPSVADWIAALLGAVLAVVALIVLVAQFAPARMTRATVLVDRSAAGATRVSPSVVRRAAVQRLKDIDAIVDAAPFAHARRLDLHLRLERGANALNVEKDSRAALGEDFWTMLGVPSQPVDLTLSYATVLAPSATDN
jgi:hypothetical protein